MDGKRQIRICYWTTGGGHLSAAEALQTAIQEIQDLKGSSSDIETVIDRTLHEHGDINNLFIGLYNYLLRHHQNWMKYYHRLIEWLKPNDSKLGYILFASYARQMLAHVRPNVLVSVHPMLNHYLVLAMKELGLFGKTKFVVVVTDPNAQLWTGWACLDADLIISPNDLATNRLIEMGVQPERITTIGMPVKPAFARPSDVSREDYLMELGLNPDLLTVCLSSGSAGDPSIISIYQALGKVTIPIQAIIPCGRNGLLKAELELRKRFTHVPTAVLNYADSISELMAASDLLVTKAGGLTTFEAIARRLPMAIDLLKDAMPQEAGTVDMLIEAKLAQPIRKPDDIVSIIDSLKPVPDRQFQPLPKEHNLDRVNASHEMAEILLALATESQPVRVRVAEK